jgi:hypothetical protein
MRILCFFTVASAALVVIAGPTVAEASPGYPGAVQMYLKLSYTPPCTICHTTVVGNAATATQPFALALRAAGLVRESTTSLQTALDTLTANGTDSDCLGVSDVQQLKNGQDPNTGAFIDGSGKPAPADAGCEGGGALVPEFGCGAQIAPASVSWLGAGALATALALCLRRGGHRPRPRRAARG